LFFDRSVSRCCNDDRGNQRVRWHICSDHEPGHDMIASALVGVIASVAFGIGLGCLKPVSRYNKADQPKPETSTHSGIV